MNRWRLVLALVSAIVLLGGVQAATTGLAQDRVPDDLPVWLDSRPSDAPLRGRGVVRRQPANLPDFSKTWVLIIDGTKQAPGVCNYSLGFSEPVDQATPKEFWMTAVDPATCRVEFTVGIPTQVELLPQPGGELESSEERGRDHAAVQAPEVGRLGYMSPAAVLRFQIDPGDPEARWRYKYTVVAEWKDIAGIVVNQC